MALWSGMASGGLYFIEDLQVSRRAGYNSQGISSILFHKIYFNLMPASYFNGHTDPKIPGLIFTDHIHSWIEQLLTGELNIIKGGSIIPKGIRWIACQW